MYACMYVFICVYMYASTHACMNARTHASARVCNGVSFCLCIKTFRGKYEVWYEFECTISLGEKRPHGCIDYAELYYGIK